MQNMWNDGQYEWNFNPKTLVPWEISAQRNDYNMYRKKIWHYYPRYVVSS